MGQPVAQGLDRAERLRQAQTVAGRCTHCPHSSRQALQVTDLLERIADGAAHVGIEQLLDGIVARADLMEGEQRVRDPGCQSARTRGGYGFVENREQASEPRALARSPPMSFSMGSFAAP